MKTDKSRFEQTWQVWRRNVYGLPGSKQEALAQAEKMRLTHEDYSKIEAAILLRRQRYNRTFKENPREFLPNWKHFNRFLKYEEWMDELEKPIELEEDEAALAELEELMKDD